MDQVDGTLVKGAARFAGCVALDPTVRRIGRIPGDSRQLQRTAVDPRSVPVPVLEEGRPIRHDPIEVNAGRRPTGEGGHVPAVPDHPGSIRVGPRVGVDRRDVGIQAWLDLVERAEQQSKA